MFDYIVTIRGIPAQLNSYRNTSPAGILLVATPATTFSNRRAARRAIDRTIKFANAMGYPWKRNEYEIYRLANDVVVVNRGKY